VEREGHRFVPFAVSSLGRLGGHASAMLDQWAERSARMGSGGRRDWKVSVPEKRRELLTRWMQDVSVCIHGHVAGLVSHRLAPLVFER